MFSGILLATPLGVIILVIYLVAHSNRGYNPPQKRGEAPAPSGSSPMGCLWVFLGVLLLLVMAAGGM